MGVIVAPHMKNRVEASHPCRVRIRALKSGLRGVIVSELSVEDVRKLAETMGLELDESRARTIASRLSGIMEVLDEIPDELLESVEPAHRFEAGRE